MNKLDLVGKTFGKLIVVEVDEKRSKDGQQRYKCLCSCGKYITTVSGRLVSGNTKSCGCSRLGHARNIKQTGTGNFNSLYADYKHGAKNRNYEFTVTKDEFAQLTKLDCYYCGAKPSTIKEKLNQGKSKYNGVYIYNGLDRIDNTKGYTIDNVVPACQACNRAKLTDTHDAYIARCKAVAVKHS